LSAPRNREIGFVSSSFSFRACRACRACGRGEAAWAHADHVRVDCRRLPVNHRMYETTARRQSTHRHLRDGCYHLPFITPMCIFNLFVDASGSLVRFPDFASCLLLSAFTYFRPTLKFTAPIMIADMMTFETDPVGVVLRIDLWLDIPGGVVLRIGSYFLWAHWCHTQDQRLGPTTGTDDWDRRLGPTTGTNN
jgi:hypothetical protein